MDLIDSVKTSINESFQLREKVIADLAPVISTAGDLLVKSIKSGGKILSCGNGGSASDAGHFTAEIVNRFQIEREPLPAISLVGDVATLTAIANDYDYRYIFSKQIKALGRKDDVLLAISTSGNSPNVIEAILEAQQIGMKVIALTGKDGGKLGALLKGEDIEIRVDAKITARIQEIHILIIHCLCELIDKILFANNPGEIT